jgi:hypothetical protein
LVWSRRQATAGSTQEYGAIDILNLRMAARLRILLELKAVSKQRLVKTPKAEDPDAVCGGDSHFASASNGHPCYWLEKKKINIKDCTTSKSKPISTVDSFNAQQ